MRLGAAAIVPIPHGFLTKAILKAEAKGPMSSAERVEGVLHHMVLSNTASADAVARLFGISERALRRRLNEEGKNLMQLVDAARFELARQLLDNTDLPTFEIAAGLQYTDRTTSRRRDWVMHCVSSPAHAACSLPCRSLPRRRCMRSGQRRRPCRGHHARRRCFRPDCSGSREASCRSAP